VSALGHRQVGPARVLVVALVAWLLLAAGGCGARTTLGAGEPPSSSGSGPSEDAPLVPVGGTTSSTMPTPMEEPPMPPVRRPCEAVSLTLDELRPAVTLLVDQSGSMRAGYPTRDSGQTRWAVVRQALLDPERGVVQSLQQSVQFALVFYTSHNGFSGGGCPILSQVPAATNNYEPIVRLYDARGPDDDTPTGDAVLQVTSEIGLARRRGPEVILLVTDGDPDTCEQPDPQGGQDQAIKAVMQAHAAGIELYVLGVSSDISGDKLQQLANAGQGKAIDAVWGVDVGAAEPFQASDSVAGLTEQLRDILARVPLCQVELDRDVLVSELNGGSVVLDGQALRYGSPDGFTLKDSRHLEIQGQACETLRAAGKHLSVRISCD
jgi:hypothetical protein